MYPKFVWGGGGPPVLISILHYIYMCVCVILLCSPIDVDPNCAKRQAQALCGDDTQPLLRLHRCLAEYAATDSGLKICQAAMVVYLGS